MTSVHALPALTDNLIWILQDGHHAWVVDPGEAASVAAFLHQRGLQLNGILITHHHADHIAGVAALCQGHEVPVWGPDDARIATVTHPVGDGEVIELHPSRLQLSVMATPGHTASHIAFYGAGHLFAGDTLFAGGCGRLFEGTPAQMLASLERLAALPANTQLCCGHEYTLSNLQFAAKVEPDNTALQARLAQVQLLRQAGQCTLPVSLGTELATNPFLRCRLPSVAKAVQAHHPHCADDPLSVFTQLRQWKDQS